jgi:hypothetical protein
MKDALMLLKPTMRAFVVAVEKSSVSLQSPLEYAFEQLCSRFDMFLMRKYRRNPKGAQRGIIVFDKSSYETSLQGLAIDFRAVGHRWGVVRNLAEVPVFLDSRASRLVQLADLISYAAYRFYERGDAQFFDLVQPRLDAEGGTIHGLHYRR